MKFSHLMRQIVLFNLIGCVMFVFNGYTVLIKVKQSSHQWPYLSYSITFLISKPQVVIQWLKFHQ